MKSPLSSGSLVMANNASKIDANTVDADADAGPTQNGSCCLSSDAQLQLLLPASSNLSSAQGFKAKEEFSNTALRNCRGHSAVHRGKKCSAKVTTSGRWTASEHNAFLRGLKIYGREWKKVVTCIPSRTPAQIRSHAQKYFAKQSKELQNHPSLYLPVTSLASDPFVPLGDISMTESLCQVIKSIMNDPSSIESRVCATLALLRERHKALEERLQATRVSSPCEKITPTENITMGPATAALEQEQKLLRKAAEARYEMKKRQRQLHRAMKNATPDVETTSCALVSLASMRSYGGFDSNDVIALSMLSKNLGNERSHSELNVQNQGMQGPKKNLCVDFARAISSHSS